jgi:predicted NUDIX family phosphoesterase
MSKILVVPTAEIEKHLRVEGFIPYDESVFLRLLQHGEFREREEMETDPQYKQLIPYVIFFNGESIFVYQRSSKSDESRLRKKYSLGIGGHIEHDDQGQSILHVVYRALVREVEEELGLSTTIEQYTFLGFIHDNTDNVGRVHLGLVCQYPYLENIKFQGGETDILLERKILHVPEVQNLFSSLESWSQIVFREFRRTQDPVKNTV